MPAPAAGASGRALRLALRLLGGAAAGWVPSAPSAHLRQEGPAEAGLLRGLGERALAAGAGFVVEDTAAHPGLRALADRFRFVVAVPTPAGALVVVGTAPRPTPSGDLAALADLALLAADAAPLPARQADAELAAIFDGAPDAVMFAGPDRRLRRVNPAAGALFGYTQAEMVGQPTAILYADPEEHERLGRERFCEDAPRALEPIRTHWRRKDGSTFLGEIVGAPLRDADGAHLGFMGLIRDVTDEVAAAEALQEREAQLRTVVEHFPIILFELDAEGYFTTSAGQGLHAVGLRPGQLVGVNVFERYAGYPDLLDGLRRGLRGEPIAITSVIEGVTFDNRTTPVFDAEGRTVGLIGVAMDVSDRARAELQAREARREAEQAAHAQGAFLAAMSHEIRTPLTGIIGFADVLAEVAEGEAHAYAEIIRKSGHRLLDTLNSVLHLARLDAHEVPARPAPTDVGTTVAEAAGLLRPLAERKGLAFRVDAPALPLHSDASLLHRIVTNLVGNAIKFTDAGHVTVTVRPEGEGATVRVEDTGRGMDPSFIPHLFEPFRREEDRPGLPSGTGLGLTITARLVELLGGSLDVASVPDEGTAFTLRLPGAAPGAPEPTAAEALEEPVFE
jgi:PAS domain S-box-containing protein